MTKSVQEVPNLSERTLLDELNHRINNDFASAINLVAVSALRSNNTSVKAALGNVVELLHGLAEVNRVLKTPNADVVVDAAEYLHPLCRSMSRSRLDRLGIKLVLATETVWLHSERCWRLGLIVHELITNAARHALFQEGNGEVEVDLPGGKKVQLGEGAFFGEMALLGNTTRSANITTTRVSQLLVLDLVDFRLLMARHPDLGQTIDAEAKRRALENK